MTQKIRFETIAVPTHLREQGLLSAIITPGTTELTDRLTGICDPIDFDQLRKSFEEFAGTIYAMSPAQYHVMRYLVMASEPFGRFVGIDSAEHANRLANTLDPAKPRPDQTLILFDSAYRHGRTASMAHIGFIRNGTSRYAFLQDLPTRVLDNYSMHVR